MWIFLNMINQLILQRRFWLEGGEIPNARAQLELANGIKNSLYDQIDAAIEENQDERIQEFVENSISSIEEMLEKGENIGLTKKAIRELESTLDVLINGDNDEILEKTSGKSEYAKEMSESRGKSGDAPGQSGEDPGKSGDAPGQSGEDPGKSGDAPGQSGEDPGKSGDAPGQNRGNQDAPLPPGEGAAGENPADTAIDNENAVGLGLGTGKIPPGLAKLFGYDDGTNDNANFVAPEGLPPGFGAAGNNPSESGFANGIGLGLGGENIPPGQLKKFDVSFAFNENQDDFFENSFEGSAEGNFEGTYDGTNKGHADGKGLFGAFPGKSGDAPGKDIGNNRGGNPDNKGKNDTVVCHFNGNTIFISNNPDALATHLGHGDAEEACPDSGVFDGDALNTSGATDSPYTIELFTARANVSTDITDDIGLDIINPKSESIIGTPLADQPHTFTPDFNGDWEIIAKAQSFTKSRIVTFTGGNSLSTADAGPDQTKVEGTTVTLVGLGSDDPDGDDDNTTITYAWTKTGGPGNPTITGANTNTATFTAPAVGGPDPLQTNVLEFTLIVTDSHGLASIADTVIITVTQNFT